MGEHHHSRSMPLYSSVTLMFGHLILPLCTESPCGASTVERNGRITCDYIYVLDPLARSLGALR